MTDLFSAYCTTNGPQKLNVRKKVPVYEVNDQELFTYYCERYGEPDFVTIRDQPERHHLWKPTLYDSCLQLVSFNDQHRVTFAHFRCENDLMERYDDDFLRALLTKYAIDGVRGWRIYKTIDVYFYDESRISPNR